jgi:NAD dependent epimerase/dehydratase family enzyme
LVIRCTDGPYLEAQGHTVIRLVRDKAKSEAFWNPRQGVIELPPDAGIGAVINLSGENFADGRWTADKKERIRPSRIEGTLLSARTVAELKPRPKAFLSSSGIPLDSQHRPFIY